MARLIFVSCTKHKIPCDTFAAILMQESGYNVSAVNKKCNESGCIETDFGISQIHKKTVKLYKFDKNKLVTDLQYSVEAGAKVLAYFKRYERKEPNTWWARFNTGTGKKSQIKVAYNEYVSLVSRYH